MSTKFDPWLKRYASQLHGQGRDPKVVLAELDEREERRKGSSRVRRAAWLASMVTMGLVVGLVIVGVMKFVNDPVEATARGIVKPPVVKTPAPGVNQLGGLHFSFSYPDIFNQAGQIQTDNQALEQYLLGTKGDYRRQLAVEVRPLQPGGVQDDAAYKYRKLHPDLYDEQMETVAGDVVVTMTKRDHQEKTLFWGHQDKFLSVSVTSINPSDDLAAYLAVIRASVRWYK